MSNQSSSTADTAIIMVGLTGSGKSTFINEAKGQDVAATSDGLDSCTKQVQAFAVPHPYDRMRRLFLVDTPGFDDTFGDDRRVMKGIADWFANPQNRHLTLAGILCFHEITLTRMGWGARSAFTTLLCSDARLSNVLLVTTKWGEVERGTGEKREADLKNIYWNEMMQSGATMMRFERTQTSALKILDVLLQKTPISVQSLVDQQRSTRVQHPRSWQKSNMDVVIVQDSKGTMGWFRRLFH